MKKCLTLFLLVIAFQVFAQNYPVTGIDISLSGSPDANTANWGAGKTMLTITATAKAVTGRVDPMVEESKLLLTIKKGGVKVCGAFTGSSAPAANFSTLTKVWSGTNAVSFLGKDCVLAPGDYEICVQFFGYGAAGAVPFSEEKCKPFSIREVEQLTYQPPQPIAPADGSEFTEAELRKPLVFRWIPVTPKPQDPVTYRLKVWQLMQGQTGTQAMQVNQPLITKDVDNITQTVENNLTGGPCLPPYLCDFIWNVQALNHEGKPIGENNGMSISSKFSTKKSGGNILAAESAGCKDYSFELRKIYKGDSVAYECIINNKYRGTDTKNNLEPGRPYLLTVSDLQSTYHFNFKVTNDREK
jgi:hypothetical protein